FKYKHGSRVAPIVCSPDLGWHLVRRKDFEKQQKEDDFLQIGGAHGYDNMFQDMQATFIAHGAAFKRGFVAEPFENVEVYNIMAHILGLKAAKNDGDLNRVKKMLR
ncbi:MAG: alkaline phosphatase family protein, partial [Pyrinomonadaceae bacterium]